MYGQAWVALARWNIAQAWIVLKDIANAYPYSYIYRAIGDRYTTQKDRENAKIFYVRALALTASETQQGITKAKLYAIFPFLSTP
jgi:predicted negative regulator of RcsB-dependent stress response